MVPIGAGGMGRVWVAREENTGRLFAIKTTLADEKSGGEFWNVLLDEARIAAQIQHRSVCAIHAFEVDEQRGVPYLVMDYSDGGSLHELLEASPDHRIEPVLASSIIAILCDGLQAAHDLSDEHGAMLGVVHRDVSPQNILISTRGDVQLTDFGVAKARGRLHAATVTGEIKGKLSYMAPEQVTTGDVDRRADVFALGCVLYEATAGVRPFHGDDPLATLYQLLEQPLVLPSERMAGYPPGLESVVVKALARSPAERYQSADEMGHALSVWIASQGRIVTEKEIAKLVRDQLGAKVAERTRRISSAETDIDSPPPSLPTERTLEGASANTAAFAQAEKARTSKLRWAIVAAAACVGIALIFLRSGGSQQAVSPHLANSASETAASASAAALTPPVEQGITLTLRAEPSFATLFLDDGAALPNPYKLTVARDHATHRVRAAAAGFSDRVQEIHFDASQELTLALSPAGNNPPPRTVGTRVGAGAVGVAAPPASASTTAHARTGDLPPVVKKPPRTLDPDNPFATP
ncbi:MAG: serine/threonine-protein kinase [Polyangiaceae bacterium]